jgi:ribosomal protein S18 acetylase RimI-like enzyme
VPPAGQVPVRKAQADDHERIARALADAFADDPAFGWLLSFPDRDRRQHLFFETILRHHVPGRREVWMTEDGGAAAVWAPPERWSVPTRQAIAEAPAMLRVFGRRLPLALRYLIKAERLHPRQPPHWYLEVLGTEPTRQGQGLGSALLRPLLALCDRDGLGAYLESSSERNRALYERHGFRVVETFDMPGGGPSIRRMWRDPGGLEPSRSGEAGRAPTREH